MEAPPVRLEKSLEFFRSQAAHPGHFYWTVCQLGIRINGRARKEGGKKKAGCVCVFDLEALFCLYCVYASG